MDRSSELKHLISQIWSEIDFIYKSKECNIDDLGQWLELLNVFQHSAEAFDFTREELGLPEEDADSIFFQKLTNSSESN